MRLATWCLLGALAAARPTWAQDPPPPDDWQAQALDQWLRVVEQHAPGVVDAALLEGANWTRDDIRASWFGLRVLLEAATSTKPTRFDVMSLDVAIRQRRDLARRVNLSRGERAALQRFVQRATVIGVPRLLMRAVVVHTDVITLVPTLVRASRGTSMRVNAGDGASVGMDNLSVHWDVARLLIALLPPSALADRFACEWYRATVAVEQRGQFFDERHLRAGLARCPNDAVLSFLAGAEREAMASSFFQALRRSMRQSAFRPAIDDVSSELRVAEEYYRRTLDLDRTLVEARVRLGRVLTLRGRPADAVTERGVALSVQLDPAVEYVAALFLGTALDLTERPRAAEEAYARAARLTFGARLPQLGLARIAFTAGEPDAMATNLDQATRATASDQPIDPWWTYLGLQARHADRWLEGVRRLAAR